MTTITVTTPAKVKAPRGAAWAAAAFAAALSWMDRFSAKALEREQSRAISTRAAEAARVRQYAQMVMSEDPRFAADLFAAADRHERS